MSIEGYAIFRAAPGSIADTAAKTVMEARRVAHRTRRDFYTALGGVGCWCCDTHVSGVVFPEGAKLPPGWRQRHTVPEGVVAVPDKKKKEGKALVFTLQSLPALPGVEKFTSLIGASGKIVYDQGRHRIRWCCFERHGDTLFVTTPFFPKGADEGTADENAANDQVFTPEGCERVPLSVYYKAKEDAEAARAAKQAEKGAAA